MPSLQSFFFVAIAVNSIWALIPYEAMKVNIFDREPRNFELIVSASSTNLVDFFTRQDGYLATITAVTALKFVPFINEFAILVPVVCEMIADQSEWRIEFSKVTKDERMRGIAESEIRW